MTEPTDQAVAARPKTTGQEIDDIVAGFPRLQKATLAAADALTRCEKAERRALDRLVELLGRPAAARMLGLTPRELAGMLRGAEAVER